VINRKIMIAMRMLNSVFSLRTLICLFLLPSALSTLFANTSQTPTNPSSSCTSLPGSPQTVPQLRGKAFRAIQAGQTAQAITLYQQALNQLKICPDPAAEALILSNLTGLESSQQRFASAVQLASRALPIAISAKDWESVAVLLIQKTSSEMNLAFYRAAETSLKQLENLLSGQPRLAAFLPDVEYLQAQHLGASLGIYDQPHRQTQRALQIVTLRRALKSALKYRNRRIQIRCWEKLGLAYAEMDRWKEASEVVATAKNTLGDALSPGLLRNLALVTDHQGDPQQAVIMLTDALQKSDRQSEIWFPEWDLLGRRARIYLKLGLRAAAIHDFERALSGYSQVRTPIGGLQADEREVFINRLLVDYVEAVSADRKLFPYQEVLRLVAQIDEHRARSLGVDDPDRAENATPPVARQAAYYQVLKRYREWESGNHGATEIQRTTVLSQLLAELQTLEQQAEVSAVKAQLPALSPPSNNPLDHLGGIPEDTLVLVFLKLSEKNLTLFALTEKEAHITRLADATSLAENIARFRKTIVSDQAASRTLGKELFVQLFGQIPTSMRQRTSWLVLPDGPVFGLPLAALSSEKQTPSYLVEEKSIRILPRWRGWVGRDGETVRSWQKLTLVADPIYNQLDERRQKSSTDAGANLWQRVFQNRSSDHRISDHQTIGLPRLVAGARESEQISRIWQQQGRPSEKVLGEQVTYQTLVDRMTTNTDILHLALHAKEDPSGRQSTQLVVRKTDQGSDEVVNTRSFVGRRIRPRLIVMNGCQTGVGEVTATGGLQGLVRDWLLGGAETVIATHWKTLDSSGTLFEEFYRELGRKDARKNGTSAADALRLAQVRMIRRGGWHAKPRHWAAFFLMGRS
jgi:CHAT domain-containing protein